MVRTALTLSLMLVYALATSACGKSDSKKLQVAAASSLAGAFESVAKAYTAKTGTNVSLILSSSGKIAQQIREGAPYDVFASANQSYLDELAASGDVDKDSVTVYAEGRLAIWVNSGDAPKSLAELTDSHFEHIAIANPEHAPYGTAAREALQKQHLWDPLESRIVRGSNVRQAMQYVESGNAEVALIAHSLALHGGGSFSLVDSALHGPLHQGIGVVAKSPRSAEARAFIEFLKSPEGAALLLPFGLQASQ